MIEYIAPAFLVAELVEPDDFDPPGGNDDGDHGLYIVSTDGEGACIYGTPQDIADTLHRALAALPTDVRDVPDPRDDALDRIAEVIASKTIMRHETGKPTVTMWGQVADILREVGR
jgi:hypothetical protein